MIEDEDEDVGLETPAETTHIMFIVALFCVVLFCFVYSFLGIISRLLDPAEFSGQLLYLHVWIQKMMQYDYE